jgi:hypothetical protein
MSTARSGLLQQQLRQLVLGAGGTACLSVVGGMLALRNGG